MGNNIKTNRAPMGGLNFVSGKTNMPETDCIELTSTANAEGFASQHQQQRRAEDQHENRQTADRRALQPLVEHRRVLNPSD